MRVCARTHCRETPTEHSTGGHILTVDQAKRSTHAVPGGCALHAIDWKCANAVVLGDNIIAQVHALFSIKVYALSICICASAQMHLHVRCGVLPGRGGGWVGGICCAQNRYDTLGAFDAMTICVCTLGKVTAIRMKIQIYIYIYILYVSACARLPVHTIVNVARGESERKRAGGRMGARAQTQSERVRGC